MYNPAPRKQPNLFFTINNAALQPSSVKDVDTYENFLTYTQTVIEYYEERIATLNYNLSLYKSEIEEITVMKAKILKAFEDISKHLDKAIKSCPEELKQYFYLPNIEKKHYTGKWNEDLTIANLESDIQRDEKSVKDFEMKIKLIKHNIEEVKRIYG